MVEIFAKDKCPEFVYKYCTSEVYEKYIKQGKFRVGTLASYRHAYENDGAEFGDINEGNITVFMKGATSFGSMNVNREGGLIIDEFFNAYVLSTSLEYSKENHRKWFERKGCGYDVCLKIKAEEFFIEIAHKMRFRVMGQRFFMLAKPIYDNGFVKLGNAEIKNGDRYLIKSRSLLWENEYRLVCQTNAISHSDIEPVFPRSLYAIEYIEEAIFLE